MFYFTPAQMITTNRKEFPANETSFKENGIAEDMDFTNEDFLAELGSPD